MNISAVLVYLGFLGAKEMKSKVQTNWSETCTF